MELHIETLPETAMYASSAARQADLERKAISRLQEAARLSQFYYEKPLLLAYSGGKDSEVILELCKRAGVPFEVVHTLTTADAPETVYHVREVFYHLELAGVHCEIIHPRYHGQPTSMWSLIPQKFMPPVRSVRYCCQVLKEGAGKNRCMVLGVRKEESFARTDSGVAELPGKTRASKVVYDFDNGDERMVAPCRMKAKIKIHPIVDWIDRDVWSFLQDSKTEINPCYLMGFHRVGCIGCPMATPKYRYNEFRAWPKFEDLYRKAFTRMLAARSAAGKETLWQTADDVFRWWMDDKNLDGQLDMFGNEIGEREKDGYNEPI